MLVPIFRRKKNIADFKSSVPGIIFFTKIWDQRSMKMLTIQQLTLDGPEMKWVR